MNRYFGILFLTIVLLCACKSKSNKRIGNLANDDTARLFPIVELLQTEIDDVIKTPYYLYKKTTNQITKQQTDSSALSRDEFKKLVQPLLQLDINKKTDKENFDENTFQDYTTNSISIVITPINTTESIRNITALLNDQSNKLKTAFITLETKNSDTLVTKKYYYKVGKSLIINSTATINKKIVKDETQFICWNDK